MDVHIHTLATNTERIAITFWKGKIIQRFKLQQTVKKNHKSSVPARVRLCVNPAKEREMALNKSFQGPLWPFPYLIPRALKCLCHFNYNNFPVKQNFLIQRTTNLIYLTSQLFLFFCIIKKDREYWPFLEKSGPQEWVVGTTLALKQNFLSGTLSHPLRDANLSSGDRKSGDFLFFTTRHP